MTETAGRKLTLHMVYWRRPHDKDHMGDPLPDLTERLKEFDFIPRVGDIIDTEVDMNKVIEVIVNLAVKEGEAPFGTVSVYIS